MNFTIIYTLTNHPEMGENKCVALSCPDERTAIEKFNELTLGRCPIKKVRAATKKEVDDYIKLISC